MDEQNNYIEVSGTIKSLVYQNEENGYTVIRLETQDGESMTVVGCLPYAAPGEQITVTGEMTRHPTHGEQLKAQWAERSIPSSAGAIYEYLSSGAIRGIGPATATLLITEFGENTLAVIENEPEKLAQIRGFGRRKAYEISDAFKRQTGLRMLIDFLSNYYVPPIIAIRLYRAYGENALELLHENPYIMAGEKIGASFAEADRLAVNMGFEEDSPERVAAATIYELRHNAGNGHTFIPSDKLIEVTCELIGVDAQSVEEALEVLCDSEELVLSNIADRQAIYLAGLFEAETYGADRIKEICGEKPEIKWDIESLISQVEGEMGVKYADSQLYSLKIAAENSMMILTGGPGTGKTTTVRAIVSLFDKMGLKTLLTAPTGRAAKRMSEITGKDASTIHRLLEAGFSLEGDELIFRRDENDPLDCDAIILDECSMVDITILKALLKAMPESCRLIMVGDADQLPSIGPGHVFQDLIRSGLIETVRLTEIFRQTAASRIVSNAHMIIRGDYPELSGNSAESDFFFLKRTSPAQAVETIAGLCGERLPKNMGIPPMDIQVLSPTRRGETGTVYLNSVLQKVLNPSAEGKKEKNFGEIVFREGDRVMQTRNNYDIMWTKQEKSDINNKGVENLDFPNKTEQGTGVYNGDVGVIVSIDAQSETMSVLYDDRLAVYAFDMLNELEHAFAMTVHKAQGSEYRAVIFLALDGPPQLMSRSILYTAVTRARQLLIIVGGDASVFKMIDNHKVTRRFSGLRARLAQ